MVWEAKRAVQPVVPLGYQPIGYDEQHHCQGRITQVAKDNLVRFLREFPYYLVFLPCFLVLFTVAG